ncbi:LysM peptidoglycan-binding domain-containing protein [Sphingobacteriales bacterium UPWRP_1]|nr:hypothetical protein BVG80_09555 [Sphingobacteriales bacterium TSM_CSM]PSJ78596.1 LysM peptidoglycan-binding domain-containing protein [Sphingobacteriales bacterium UPWRP_1]
MYKPATLIIVLLFANIAYAHMLLPVPGNANMVAASYIEQYKDLAVLEMQRTGIPASIKLAQGMFESNFGQSNLALKGNNHFGIKCKSDWTGETIYYTDDSLDECFRKYPNVYDSYKDHSDFLMSRERYAFLFALPPGDYEGWAAGLKKAGYATNEQYTEKIINIIKTYALYQYDNTPAHPVVYADNICINGKGEWVVLEPPFTQNEDLGAILPVAPMHSAGGFIDFAPAKDLKTIDNLLAQSVTLRPKGMELKCLKGAPAISVQAERIQSGFKPLFKGNLQNSGSNKAQIPTVEIKGTGRQLNPFFNPNLYASVQKPQAPATAFVPPATANQAPSPAAEQTVAAAQPLKATPPPATGKAPDKDNGVAVSASTALYNAKPETSQRATASANKEKTDATPRKTKITYKPDMSNENMMLPKQKTYNINATPAVSYAYEVLPSQIAQTYRLTTQEVLQFNDMESNAFIPPQTHIFLQAKKDKTDKGDKYHAAAENETMWHIAQLYGISLQALYARNNMAAGRQPKPGEKINLRSNGLQLPKLIGKKQ